MELKFPVGLEKNEVLIERDGIKIEVPWPVQIQILKERNKKAKYDVIRNEKNIYIAEADVEVNKENRFHITDMWEQNTNNIKLSRKVACISAEKETAIRISTEFHWALVSTVFSSLSGSNDTFSQPMPELWK